MITNAGGTPVISLIGAPSWMFGCATMSGGNCSSCYNSDGTTYSCNSSPCEPVNDVWNGFYSPPCQYHYHDFADLAAHVASALPNVKYFVVWNEFKGFYDSTGGLDYKNYTTMYNDVYTAIKKVRPDAVVGGPYLPFSAYTAPNSCSGYTLCSQQWGLIREMFVNAMQYWISNKVGADFVAVDGKTVIASANNTYGDATAAASPLDASEKYAAVDQWLKTQTDLPIWWMESHIQPCNAYDGSNCDPSTPCTLTTCWTDAQAAAARIATLALMNSSGASAGIQWQPQNQSTWQDQGLWTSTYNSSGGQQTTLGTDLLQTLSVLREPLTVVNGEPTGVLVANTKNGQTLIVNTNADAASATLSGQTLDLTGGQVIVK